MVLMWGLWVDLGPAEIEKVRWIHVIPVGDGGSRCGGARVGLELGDESPLEPKKMQKERSNETLQPREYQGRFIWREMSQGLCRGSQGMAVD